MLAPIVIFAYKRPEALKRLVASLSVSPLFVKSIKIVYIDGPKNKEENHKIEEVAAIAQGFADEVHISQSNKGLGPSIISGVSDVINKYGKAIILEDDLFVAPSFLSFINKGLDLFEKDKRICSICGYSLKINIPANQNIFLSNRSSSWGWGTWKDRWDSIDWEVSDFEDFIHDKNKRKSFNRGGSDMTGMLRDYMVGRNKSWAIRFCYWQWKNGLWSVHPAKSLIDNYGFGEDASNCRQKYSRYKTDMNLRENEDIIFDTNIEPNQNILKQLRKYNSIPIRIYSKIRKIITSVS